VYVTLGVHRQLPIRPRDLACLSRPGHMSSMPATVAFFASQSLTCFDREKLGSTWPVILARVENNLMSRSQQRETTWDCFELTTRSLEVCFCDVSCTCWRGTVVEVEVSVPEEEDSNVERQRTYVCRRECWRERGGSRRATPPLTCLDRRLQERRQGETPCCWRNDLKDVRAGCAAERQLPNVLRRTGPCCASRLRYYSS